MFDNETAENINKINRFLGTSHRSAPYDLSSPDDLKQAFRLTAAASLDYRRYWRQLTRMEEEVDESVENYDPSTWINMSVAPEKTDSAALEAMGSLRETTDLFYTLIERADKNCVVILKAILSAPPETQNTVLGAAYHIPADKLDGAVKELFEGLDETDAHYEVDANCDEFLSLMKDMWGQTGE